SQRADNRAATIVVAQPVKVPLGADHQVTVDLIVATDLAAADEPAVIIIRPVQAKERIGPVVVGPGGADVATYVTPRPCERHRHVAGDRDGFRLYGQIGRACEARSKGD